MSFHFTLQDSLEHFLLGTSSGHEFPQLLFIWECLDFSLTFLVFFFVFWLHQVLVAARGIFVEACGIFCCGEQALRCSVWASL